MIDWHNAPHCGLQIVCPAISLNQGIKKSDQNYDLYKTPTVSLRPNSYCFNCHPSMYCFIRTQVLLFTCNETEVGSLLRCIIVHWDAIPTVSLWPHCASNTFWCCGRALCQHTMYFWEWANQRNTCSPVTTYMRSTICICICISERGLIKGTLVLWW